MNTFVFAWVWYDYIDITIHDFLSSVFITVSNSIWDSNLDMMSNNLEPGNIIRLVFRHVLGL